MDANRTRFHLLLGQADWEACSFDPGRLEFDLERDELRLRARAYLFVASPRDRRLALADRRGAGCDAYGNWYAISADERSILVRSSGTGASSLFWAAGEAGQSAGSPGAFRPAPTASPAPRRLRGLAVTGEHYLVAGMVEPAGLLVFDLHAGGAPREIRWPAPFAPFDLAPAPDGGLWILDRPLERAPGDPPARYWALDRRLEVLALAGAGPAASPAPDFGPDPRDPRSALALPPGRTPREVGPEAALDVPAGDPVAIEALPDGTILILDNGGDGGGEPPCAQVWRLGPGRTPDGPVSLRPLLERIDQAGRRQADLLGHDFTFVPGASKARPQEWGLLLVVTPGGNQSFAFVLELADDQLGLRPQTDYLPMRLFGGKALVAARSRAFYDMGDDWLPLVRQPRARYVETGELLTPLCPKPSAAGERPTLDSGEPGCVWHRLVFDGSLPPGAALAVRSRAADTEDELAQTIWQAEPEFYRRGGSELPFSRGAALDDEGTWELLLQRARGRYLQLELTLSGDGRNTPRLRALRVYYPRFSYLERYLPAAYRADATSASFLERFLANLEGFYTTIEDKIAAAQLILDARTAPPEYLDWLAGWLGVVLDPSWEEGRRRLFLRYAHQLFRQRGTVPGLVRALRLAADTDPDESIFEEGAGAGAFRIVEDFATRRAPGVVFGDPSEPEGPGVTTAITSWSLKEGAAPLHRRYGVFLCERYARAMAIGEAWGARWDSVEAISLPAAQVAGRSLNATWREFLEMRYGTIEALSQAWGENLKHFETLSLPLTRPKGETAAADWHTFLALDALNRAWDGGYTGFEVLRMPPTMPEGMAERADWRRFLRAGLGFTHAEVGPHDAGAYRAFLRRRYSRVEDLPAEYRPAGGAYTAFEQIGLPAALPEQGAPLRDWIQFASALLPAARKAHSFTVLVPASAQAAGEERGTLSELVRRVVNLEKPAHTRFEVKEYWALFRVGEARLGLDSQIDRGSRLTALVLDQSALAQSYLSPAHPWSARDRAILGRDPIGGAQL